MAEGVSLCQFLAELPFRAQAEAEAELAGLLLYLNNIIPLGAFGLRQPGGVLWHRCVLVLGPAPDGNGRVAVETVLLISHIVDQLSSMIEAVASGKKTRAEAVAVMEGDGRSAPLN